MPLNRFITFVKPYINLIAGAIAAALVAKANVLGIPGIGDHGNELQTGIAAALAWGVTQLVTQLGDLKWLRGHQLAMAGDLRIQAAVAQAQAPAAAPVAAVAPEAAAPQAEAQPAGPALHAVGEELPEDDEEFAAPPPDETNMPVQPSQFAVEELAA